jgi:hypothetical protein
MAGTKKDAESLTLMRELCDGVERIIQRQEKKDREHQFAERRRKFLAWMEQDQGAYGARVGFRITAMPSIAYPSAGEIYRNRSLSRDLREIPLKTDPSRSNLRKYHPGQVGLSEYPALGGARWISVQSAQITVQQLILRSGLIEIWLKRPWIKLQNQQKAQPNLHFDWMIGSMANTLLRMDAFRHVAGGASEYWLELEVLSVGGASEARVQLTDSQHGTLGEGIQIPELFGPYEIAEDRDSTINLIVRDLYDASGESGARPLSRLEIDWSEP